MPCHCQAKGCQNRCDCMESLCEWHLIEFDDGDVPPEDYEDEC